MPKNQTEMMKKLIIMCALMLSMNSVVAFAQQAYTADVFCYQFDAKLCDDFNDVDSQSVIDMCYWNCADGKHKIIAENVVSMIDGKYVNGQYSGIQFYIYDNATRRVWSADEEILGAYVAVYSLPQQGKDINVVVYQGNKKCETRLVWDGMRFKRQ